MSYTPTQWQTGDTITAEKLNNMENGIKEATPLVIPVIADGGIGPYIDAAVAGDIISEIPSHSRFVFEFFEFNMKIFTAEAEYFATPLSFGDNDYLLVVSLPETLLASFGWYGYGKHDHSLMFAPATWNTGNPWVGIWTDFYGTAPFVVTLTPTAQDFSGTMDKTPAGIGLAISAGQRIMFDIPSMSASVEATQFVGGNVACANITYDISGQDVLIQIATSPSDATYSTKIFPLTPMS